MSLHPEIPSSKNSGEPVPEIQQLKPLCSLSVGSTGAVRQLKGGHDFAGRVACMGFTPGAQVTVIQNFGHGPLIVSVRDTRVALGRGEAIKILVEAL